MKEFLSTDLVLVSLTFMAYIIAQKVYQKFNVIYLNPVLLAIVSIIFFLLWTDIDYALYAHKTRVISFWLSPSVVALGVPLYLQMDKIKSDWVNILLSTLSGSVVGIVSVVLIAKGFGATQEVIYSLAPKSVSTPIALNICESIGGVQPLTAAVVVVVGIMGAVLGESVLTLMRIKHPHSVGLAIGTASHALGTAKIAAKGEAYGSYSAMGLALNGILTSLLIPRLLPFIDRFF